MKKQISPDELEDYEIDECGQKAYKCYNSDHGWYCSCLLMQEWHPKHSNDGCYIKAGFRGWYETEREALNLCKKLNDADMGASNDKFLTEYDIKVYERFSLSHPYYIWHSIGEKYWHTGKSSVGEFPKCWFKGWFTSMDDAEKMQFALNKKADLADTSEASTIPESNQDNVVHIDIDTLSEEEAIAQIQEAYKNRKTWIETEAEIVSKYFNQYASPVAITEEIVRATLKEYIRHISDIEAIEQTKKIFNEMGLKYNG